MEHALQAIIASIGNFFVVTLLLVDAILLCQHHRNSTKTRTRSSHIRTCPAPHREASSSLSVVDASWSFDTNLVKISWDELARATDNFSPHFIIDDNSFGLVCKACLSSGVTVTVKKLSLDAFQGFYKFTAEMETLSRLCHPNIVKNLSYWALGPERLLVYEFIEKGSLDQWLHKPDISLSLPPLPWPILVNIIRGMALEEVAAQHLHGLRDGSVGEHCHWNPMIAGGAGCDVREGRGQGSV
ncbi:hypothetical protein GYH30_052199 [Glycine max]|uniref:Protein kinase domain-containing protein n=1 Tax=Glycine max TaxID=3847 RepID=K7MWV1_SOYBN|nr:hypothetical protein GYH30_052199 [Glycine max]